MPLLLLLPGCDFFSDFTNPSSENIDLAPSSTPSIEDPHTHEDNYPTTDNGSFAVITSAENRIPLVYKVSKNQQRIQIDEDELIIKENSDSCDYYPSDLLEEEYYCKYAKDIFYVAANYYSNGDHKLIIYQDEDSQGEPNVVVNNQPLTTVNVNSNILAERPNDF